MHRVDLGMKRIKRKLWKSKAKGRSSSGSAPTDIFSAVEALNKDAVAQFLKKAGNAANRKVLANQPREDGCTPLHLAIETGSVDCARALLDAGANPVSIFDGWTPLQVAAGTGHSQCLALLIETAECRAVLNDGNSQDPNGRNELHIASLGGHEDCVRLLLVGGADAKTLDASGRTALLLAVEEGNEVAARYLIDNGDPAAVGIADPEGVTPLMLACQTCSPEIVRYLLQNGADPTRRDGKGLSALDAARVAQRHDNGAVIASALTGARPPSSGRASATSLQASGPPALSEADRDGPASDPATSTAHSRASTPAHVEPPVLDKSLVKPLPGHGKGGTTAGRGAAAVLGDEYEAAQAQRTMAASGEVVGPPNSDGRRDSASSSSSNPLLRPRRRSSIRKTLEPTSDSGFDAGSDPGSSTAGDEAGAAAEACLDEEAPPPGEIVVTLRRGFGSTSTLDNMNRNSTIFSESLHDLISVLTSNESLAEEAPEAHPVPVHRKSPLNTPETLMRPGLPTIPATLNGMASGPPSPPHSTTSELAPPVAASVNVRAPVPRRGGAGGDTKAAAAAARSATPSDVHVELSGDASAPPGDESNAPPSPVESTGTTASTETASTAASTAASTQPAKKGITRLVSATKDLDALHAKRKAAALAQYEEMTVRAQSPRRRRAQTPKRPGESPRRPSASKLPQPASARSRSASINSTARSRTGSGSDSPATTRRSLNFQNKPRPRSSSSSTRPSTGGSGRPRSAKKKRPGSANRARSPLSRRRNSSSGATKEPARGAEEPDAQEAAALQAEVSRLASLVSDLKAQLSTASDGKQQLQQRLEQESELREFAELELSFMGPDDSTSDASGSSTLEKEVQHLKSLLSAEKAHRREAEQRASSLEAELARLKAAAASTPVIRVNGQQSPMSSSCLRSDEESHV